MSIMFILALVSSTVVFGGKLEDGWKGIKPLRSDVVSVEKILGKPDIDANGFYRYRDGENFVRVNYSTKPCEESMFGRGMYNVPAGTVLNYEVHVDPALKLSDVDFDRAKYYRDTSGDVVERVLYVNGSAGVWITVGVRDGIEYVAGFTFWPSNDDKTRLKCSFLRTT